MAIWNRQRTGHNLAGLTHHSDLGVQYLSISYSERLADNDIVASVGSKGDSYDCDLMTELPGPGLTLHTSTLSPKPSTASTRPNLSGTRALGAGSTTSNSPPSNGSTGSTTDASTTTSAASRQPTTKPTTIVKPDLQTPQSLYTPSTHKTRSDSVRRTPRS